MHIRDVTVSGSTELSELSGQNWFLDIVSTCELILFDKIMLLDALLYVRNFSFIFLRKTRVFGVTIGFWFGI